ncbi:MAG: SBBP repeat-containing protein, partial [Bacteroidota bacterium]
GGFQNTFGGVWDAFLVKFDANGNRLWATYYGGTAQDYGNSVTTDASGNVYMAGHTFSTSGIASGGFQNTFGGNRDAFLVKFDANGNRLWATYYGGTAQDHDNSVTTDASGNVYMAGITQSTSGIASEGFQNIFGGYSDTFLVKFDANGNRLWATYYGGTNGDYGTSVTTDASGNVYMAGYTSSASGIASGGFQNTYGGGNDDAFLVKFDANGNRLWATYYGGTSEDYVNSVTTDASGNVYMAGTTTSTSGIASGGFQNTLGGGFDAFLVKFNANGNRLWATYYGGTAQDNGYSVTTDASGNVYMAGSTGSISGITSCGFQNTLGGYSDAFLVRFGVYSPPSVNAGNSLTICNGSSTTLSVTTTGGTLPYTYQWSPAAELSSPTISNPVATPTTPTTPTTYTVLVTDCANYTGTDMVTITVIPQPTITITGITTICSGSSTILTAYGGVSYIWLPGGQTTTNITVSPATATTYTVIGTGANGCSATSTPITVMVPNPAVSVSGTNVSCNGGSNGSATANPSGGINPYSYLWSNGQINQTATALGSGSYTVTITDANGCTAFKSIYITEPTALSLSKSFTNASCYNNEGTANVTVSGGVFPYSYLWNNGQTNQTATTLGSGSYTITITDANGCNASDTVQINNSVVSSELPICAVTVDSLSKYNLIIWNKTSYPIADTFFVYRDTANNNYALIGKVPYTSLSQFIDTVRTLYSANGDPNASTWKYKIAVKDTCGNISQMSPSHKTLFIQNNNGNFSWNEYLIEGQTAPIPSLSNYLFQRDNFSTGNNWVTIQTLSAFSTSYTDNNYATYKNTGSWRVLTKLSINCISTIIKNPQPMISYNFSRSNIGRMTDPTVLVNTLLNESNIIISPNPNRGEFNISINKPTGNATCRITDIIGREVWRNDNLKNNDKVNINLPDAKGIYILRIITDSGIINKKIVVE